MFMRVVTHTTKKALDIPHERGAIFVCFVVCFAVESANLSPVGYFLDSRNVH
jgi:hypothetical protein